MKQPRTLVISHNCFSTFQNMGKTLKGLFSEFEKEGLFQLYFYSSYPDIDICESMFRITDLDMMNSLFHLRKEHGGSINKNKINKDNALFDSEISAAKYNKARGGRNNLIAFRDMLWGLRRWDTKELNEWLDRINPEVIFFAAGDSIFSYTISMLISKRRNIPLVVYFCDDYYFLKSRSLSPLYQIHKYLLRRTIKKIVTKAQTLIYISPNMEAEYSKYFGKTGEVIMTPYQEIIKRSKEPGELLILTYAGNISLNRWKTLRLIGDALAKINKNGIKAVLNIYSGSKNTEITNQLTIKNAMYFKGNKSPEELKGVIEESDILVHVESFEKSDIERVKYSVSTKIPDYLASNRIIMAVGPEEVASISYLKENGAAYVIENKSMIENKLKEYLSINENDKKIIKNSIDLSNKNHNLKLNSTRLKNLLSNSSDI